MIDLLDDHNTSIQAYRYLLSTQTVQNDKELVESLLRGMQKSIEALNGIR